MMRYAGTVETAQLLSRLGSDTVLRCLSDLAGNGPDLDLVPMPDDPKDLFGSVSRRASTASGRPSPSRNRSRPGLPHPSSLTSGPADHNPSVAATHCDASAGDRPGDDEVGEPNLTWQTLQPRERRWQRMGQRPAIAWLTGLSGSGKSTIADAADRALTEAGRSSMVLDGDNLRQGLSRDLGFTAVERAENIRRAAEIARLMAEAGLLVIVSLISPFRADRAAARTIAGDIPFLEIHVDTPLALCEARDPKGLYAHARAGAISDFTGISAPYEAPEAPDLALATAHCTVSDSTRALVAALLSLSERPPHPKG